MATSAQLSGRGLGSFFDVCPGCRQNSPAQTSNKSRLSAQNVKSIVLPQTASSLISSAFGGDPTSKTSETSFGVSSFFSVADGLIQNSVATNLRGSRSKRLSAPLATGGVLNTGPQSTSRVPRTSVLRPGSSSREVADRSRNCFDRGPHSRTNFQQLRVDCSASPDSRAFRGADTALIPEYDGQEARHSADGASESRVWRRGGISQGNSSPYPGSSSAPLKADAGGSSQGGKSVLVSNLPPETSLAELESFFDAFGPLDSVQLLGNSDGYHSALVQFLEPWASDSAATAVRKADGATWKGYRLEVSFENGESGALFKPKQRPDERSGAGLNRTQGGSLSGDSDRSGASELPEGEIRLRFKHVVSQLPPDARAAEHLFSQLPFPVEWEYAKMVWVYALQREKHKARALFEQMCDRGIRPSRLAYHNLLQAYCNSGDILGARSLVREMKANGMPPDGITYGYFVLHYSRTKDRRKVLEVFDTIRRQGLDAPPNVYSAAIHAHVQFRSMRPAEELFEHMERERIPIPLGAYNALLDGCAVNGDERGALRLYEKLKAAGVAPSVITFGALIKLYTRKGKMAEAMQVVAEMQSLGIEHSKQTYSMLISGHSAVGDVEAAYATFQAMARSRNRPDVIAYTAIITCFAKAGQMERAYDMLKSMEQSGLRPNDYTYTALIDGWAKQGDLPKAMETIRAMRASGTMPTVATFTCIVSALARTGQMTKAVKVVDEMRKLNVAPDTGLFTSLISGYANIGDVLSAFEVFKRVKAEGFPLDKRIYTTLINACAKVGRMQSAVAVVGEMRALGIEPDVITYNALLDGWAKRGDIWEAADVMEQMQAAGVKPDVSSFCTLIYACMKASEMDKALAVLEEMESLGFKPTLEIYSVLIEGWCQAGDAKRALSIFAHLKRDGLEPDYPVYHSLMSGLVQIASRDVSSVYDDVIELAGEMRELGYQADASTARFWGKQLPLIKPQLSDSSFDEFAAAVLSLLPPKREEPNRPSDQIQEAGTSPPREEDTQEEEAERPSNPLGGPLYDMGERENASVSDGVERFTRLEGAQRPGRLRDTWRVSEASESRSAQSDYRKDVWKSKRMLEQKPEPAPVKENAASTRGDDGVQEVVKNGVWRNPKQQRMLEASKELEAQYDKSRMEEMLTFLTQAEQEDLGSDYELIDPASRLGNEGTGVNAST